ncbi:hypothetical protein YC2023_117916 [Brassica napus]
MLIAMLRDDGVSAIASHLTRSMAVSTSFGGDFKIAIDIITFCRIRFGFATVRRARRLKTLAEYVM